MNHSPDISDFKRISRNGTGQNDLIVFVNHDVL